MSVCVGSGRGQRLHNYTVAECATVGPAVVDTTITN